MKQARPFDETPLAEYLVAAMAAAGLFLRLINLGHLNFWGDESITALAVQGILEHGYPRFPSGMIYVRGLFANYISALSASIWGMTEWALRLPSVLFSCGTIVMLYALGKRVFSSHVGLLAAFILTFSYWDFEFARHGRMYAGFTFVFLLSLYAIYRGAVAGEQRWFRWSILISASTIFFHELGLTLALVYLALAVQPGRPNNERWYLGGAAFVLVVVTGVHFILVQYGFAIPGQEHGYRDFFQPFGIIRSFFQKFYGLLPKRVVMDLWPLALALALALLLAKWRLRGQRFYIIGRWLLPLAVLLATYGRQFTLAALLIGGYLFFSGKGFEGWRSPEIKLAAGLIVLMFGFWAVRDWSHWQNGDEALTLINRVREFLKLQAGLPKLYYLGFLYAFPVMALFVCFALLLLLHASHKHSGAYFTCIAFILPILATGYIKTNWVEYRLNLHLNPLFVLLYAFISREIWHCLQTQLRRYHLPAFSRIATPLAAAFIFALSCEQTDPWRITKVLSRTYGSKVDPRSAPGSHFRIMPDHQLPGRFVKQYHQPQDIVIAMDWLAQSYYAGHIDFWLRSDAYVPQTYRVGENYFDVYTGTQVLSSLTDLEAVLTEHPNRRVWIITASPYTEADLHISPEIMDYLQINKPLAVFQGRDDKSLVYLFPAERACRR